MFNKRSWDFFNSFINENVSQYEMNLMDGKDLTQIGYKVKKM